MGMKVGTRIWYYASVLLLTFPNLAKGQDDLKAINIVFFYDDPQTVQHFNAAVAYINSKPNLGYKVGEVTKVFSNGTSPKDLVVNLCKELDTLNEAETRPDLAVDFTRFGVQSEAVKTVVKIVNLPTISGSFGQPGDIREWRTLSDKMKNYLIQVSPPADVLVQSVRSIVDEQNMTSAVLLFNTEYEMYHKYKALLQNMPTRHLLTQLKYAPEQIRSQIDKLVHVDIVNFFIAGSPEEITNILIQASSPDVKDGPYFSDEFAWYSMSLEPGLPKCTACSMNVSVVHLSPLLKSSGEKRRGFLETQENIKTDRLTDMFYFDLTVDAISAVGSMKKSDEWPTLPKLPCANFGGNTYPDELELNLLKVFKTVGKENILGEFVFEPDGKNYPQFQMKIERLLFREKSPEPYAREDVGVWNAGFGDSEQIEFKAGKNLMEHVALTVFRIVTVVQPPFVYKIEGCDEFEEKYSRCFEGYCIDLLNKIQEELRFNYTIRNVTEYGYMSEAPPHEWSGMVKELKDRKADIALGAMSVMAERETVVDFTVPYYDLVGISILMRKTKATTSLFKFLTVLENDVWMCILGAYFFTSILMWIFDRWSPYSYQNNREKYEDDEEKREFNLKECLWFCMTSLTPQGGGEAPKNLSGRLVAATWWLFGFIIIASYTANLAAFLTVSRLDAPIESLDDLSKQYKIQYAPVKDSSAWIYFDRMAHIEHRFYEIWKDMSLNDSMSDYERSHLAVWDYPVSDRYTKMWQAMQENEPPATFELAIDRVRNSDEGNGFAFLGEATKVKYEVNTNCEFIEVGEEFSRKPYAIAVQKGSPLKEALSHMYAISNAFLTAVLLKCDANDIRYEVLTSCDLQMVGEEFSRKPYALAVQQGSPLKDQLNDAILKLLNQRHLEQLKEKWWNNNPYKAECPRDDNQSDGISIHNIGGVFIVIFVGIVMACFTLIFEYWWYRKRNVTQEMAEMSLPAPKEFAATFATDKTNFNTQYNKVAPRTELPSIENSW